MKKLSLIVSMLILVLACSSAGDSTTTSGGSSAGKCCTPSALGCCMDYGGWSDTGSCGMACDGMPWPTNPGWKMVKDSHGCDVWTNPKPFGSGCGAPPPPDSGPDVSSDAMVDAPIDATKDAPKD